MVSDIHCFGVGRSRPILKQKKCHLSLSDAEACHYSA